MGLSYQDLIKKKQLRVNLNGFDISEKELNPLLKPFQKQIVLTAIKKGCHAEFLDCGMGKTFIELEIGRIMAEKTGKPSLILTPLSVIAQFLEEGQKFNIECSKYEAQTTQGVYVLNYEQLKRLDPSIFGCVILDESSILKNYTGKTKTLILQLFAETKYKFACTATPSPNDLNELGNHSEFLNVMQSEIMRMRWFVRDEGMSNYGLKGHAETDFFGWVGQWATVARTPSDLGFDGSEYLLPNLFYKSYEVKAKNKNSFELFNSESVNATDYNKELRATQTERLQKAVEIVNSLPKDEQIVIWIHHNEEGVELRKLIPEAIEVKGADNDSYKEKMLLGFAKNEFRILITKPSIAAYGLNWQNCAHSIETALDFSFELFYQRVRRFYRYGQKRDVTIHVIHPDSMQNVEKTIERKQRDFENLYSMTAKSVNNREMNIKINNTGKNYISENLKLFQGDSFELIQQIPSNSIDYIVFSPPFSNLFVYSDDPRDMGNNESHEAFFEQYSFLLKELYRVLKNGRLISTHTKNLAVYKNSSGYSGIDNFTAKHDLLVESMGFKLHAQNHIWIDPVIERERTNTQRLLYGQVTSDSCYSGGGMVETFSHFRKWEGSEEDWQPITNKTKQNFPVEVWQVWASGVWWDIQRTDILSARDAKAAKDEKHIAPLQLTPVERCLKMYSMPNETVLTPFLGIGTEARQAVRFNRKAVGFELKESYFEQAVLNCKAAEQLNNQLELFQIGDSMPDGVMKNMRNNNLRKIKQRLEFQSTI